MSQLRYKIIKASTLESLETLVDAFIGQGYLPIGGLICDSADYKYCQAMVAEQYGKKISGSASLVRFLSIEESDKS